MSVPARQDWSSSGLRIEPYTPDRAEDVAQIFTTTTTNLPYCGILNADLVQDRLTAPSYFDPQALLIASRGGRPIAYSHGAFGRPPQGSETPDRSVGNIRGLFFLPEDGDAGQILLDELIAYLTRGGAQDLQGWGSFAGYPFYRGLYMGTEPVASAVQAHVVVRFVQAGFTINQRSIFLARPLEAQAPAAQAQPPVDLVTAPFAPSSTWEAETWLGLEPWRTTASREGQQVGQITWALLTDLTARRGHLVGSIAGLNVAADCRRQGIAKTLVLDVMRACYRAGAREITVATTQENTAALHTYYACGFTEREILLGHARAQGPATAEG
jgi:ribosomal protein S18 acetylase RimI-like enzyme